MTIVPTGCHGFCEQGVLVIIPDKDVTYGKVHLEDVEEIYESHIKTTNLLKDFYIQIQNHMKNSQK